MCLCNTALVSFPVQSLGALLLTEENYRRNINVCAKHPDERNCICRNTTLACFLGVLSQYWDISVQDLLPLLQPIKEVRRTWTDNVLALQWLCSSSALDNSEPKATGQAGAPLPSHHAGPLLVQYLFSFVTAFLDQHFITLQGSFQIHF